MVDADLIILYYRPGNIGGGSTDIISFTSPRPWPAAQSFFLLRHGGG